MRQRRVYAGPRGIEWTRLAAMALVASCGARTSLAEYGASADGARPDAAAPTHEAGASILRDGDAVVPCREQPWVLFSLGAQPQPGEGPPASQVYARHPDGTGGHLIALPHPFVAYPSVSPDGHFLLYTTLSSLYLFRFGATSDRLVTQMEGPRFASLSPDGTRVVYSDGDELWITSAMGGQAPTALVNGSDGPSGYPVFTADSQSVLFGSQATIQSIGVDGAGLQTLLVDPNGNGFPTPALSPDYESVATVVSCAVGSTFTLRTYALKSFPTTCEMGTIVTPVPQAVVDNGLAWGPTGLVAYSDGADVYVVGAEGGTPTKLTGDLTGGHDLATTPTWAPACTSH